MESKDVGSKDVESKDVESKDVELTHFNESGRARMVDVSAKADTDRTAEARGRIKMKPETLRLILDGAIKKGDVLSVAQVGGIMGGKKTSELIPMCHNIFLTGLNIDFEIEDDGILIKSTAKTNGKTGVEMEALTAVSVAALTIYDMCKAVDKEMIITGVELTYKCGGKSGKFIRS